MKFRLLDMLTIELLQIVRLGDDAFAVSVVYS
jgi:hypothetical protein